MKRGFMDLAVKIIQAQPGMTASEVAQEVLDIFSGHLNDITDAKNPEQSLANTLNKQVQTGLETRIRRERVGGLYKYFPAVTPSSSGSAEEVVVQLSLATQELENVDNLVAVGKFENRSKAIKWLVAEGIKTNRTYLDKVADTKKQIERLRNGI